MKKSIMRGDFWGFVICAYYKRVNVVKNTTFLEESIELERRI